MIWPALVSYMHFVSILSAFGLLVAKFFFYRKKMRAHSIYLLTKLNRGYALAVLAIILTGFIHIFSVSRGTDFHMANPIFWLKIGLFILLGFLFLPSAFEVRRNRRITEGKSIEIEEDRFDRIRNYILSELIVFALIPLAATLVANGVGR